MSSNKTVPTATPAISFLEGVTDVSKRDDRFRLMDLMQRITREDPVMWGTSIVGFGKYHYRYASGREGDMPVVGFSPRKGKLALYVGALSHQNKPLLAKLGALSTGKSCLYIKCLEQVNVAVLGQIISNTYTRLSDNPTN